jgi:tetratricopeptide (TPR) repeat protein
MGTHYERGRVCYNLGRYHEAIVELSQELAEEPQNAAALSVRASALCNLGDLRSAEEDVRTAISLEPEDSYAFGVLSKIHATRGELVAAEIAIRESLRVDPDVFGFSQLAWILHRCERFDECLEATDRALELDSSDETSLLLRARALASLGRNREANQVLLTALALHPESPAAHYEVGYFASDHGQPRDSLTALREARRLDPLRYNDSESIAIAYGRRLMPFRMIDPFVLRWYSWSSTGKWALYTFVGTYALILSLIWLHADPDPYTLQSGFGLAFWCYVVLVNLCIFSITYRGIVSATAKLVASKECDEAPFSVRFEVCYSTYVQVASVHFLGTGFFMVMSLMPPMVFLVYGAVHFVNWFSDTPFQESSSIRRALMDADIAFAILMVVIGGAIASVTEPCYVAIAIWAVLVTVAFFSANIRSWLMRRRMARL